MAPVIGITSIPRLASTAFAELPHETLPELYQDAIAEAGGVPIIIPVHSCEATELIERIDGVVLTGGGDVDPALFGSAGGGAKGIDRARDEHELAIARLAVRRDLPMLGICRGMQVLNVALGGSLHIDVESDLPEVHNHWDTDKWDVGSHPVWLEGGTKAAVLFGASIEVNSIHHQAVERPGESLVASGYASDGVIEVIEHPDRRFVFGVQWHPECMTSDPAQQRLFEHFVDHAGEGQRAGREGGGVRASGASRWVGPR